MASKPGREDDAVELVLLAVGAQARRRECLDARFADIYQRHVGAVIGSK